MKNIIRLVIFSLVMVIAASAYTDSVTTFLKCEQDDDATAENLGAVA